MVKYRYLKRYRKKIFGKSPTFFLKLFSLLFSLIGLTLVANAVTPVISYQIKFSPGFEKKEWLSPLAAGLNSASFSVFNQILGEEVGEDEFINARNWFPEAPFPSPDPQKEVSPYSLSVPFLKIFEAVVKVGVENLDKNLIQYPGTGIPGKPGNVVIFGHSVLPQFFNPKNYKTIFSTLPTLKKGEQILIDYDQVRYAYLIEEMIEVPANDVSILAQRNDDAYLSLVTCVPPGTYLRRLVVRAKLSK